MGLKASKLFSECFRASNNPKQVVKTFIGADGTFTSFWKMYLRSDIKYDRLVFETIKETQFDHGFELSAMVLFMSWSIVVAEEAEVSWDEMIERIANVFELSDIAYALELLIEKNEGEETKWSKDGARHFLKRVLQMQKRSARKTSVQDEKTQKLIFKTAKGMIGKMKIREFLADLPC